MTIAFGDSKRSVVSLRKEIDEAIARVLDSGWFVLGKEVVAFEQEFGTYLEGYHCVSVASGTEALQLALMDAGVGPGDEVITVANTAVPTVSAISAVGATPVFVDVDIKHGLMQVDSVHARLTARSKAIIPVHLYGQSVNMEPLIQLAGESGLSVIEDCAQAHGAKYHGQKVGSLGDYGCFSFYPSKNLGALGDGGAVIVRDQQRAERLMMLRNYGQSKRYYHDTVGINSRLDEMQAAILRTKLKGLDAANRRRQELAKLYAERLKVTPLALPEVASWAEPVYHLYVVQTDKRNELAKYLADQGVGTLIHYPLPITCQKAYASLKNQSEYLPNTIKRATQILSLPLYPELHDEEVLQVSEHIRHFFGL